MIVMGFGILLREAGHSLDHRQGGVHRSHDVVGDVEVDQGMEAVVSGGPAADDHPHPDLLVTLPGRPLLAHGVAARTMLCLAGDLASGRRVAPARAPALAPIQNGHGPPPPTRAPPTL
jgi:hypothetical protein